MGPLMHSGIGICVTAAGGSFTSLKGEKKKQHKPVRNSMKRGWSGRSQADHTVTVGPNNHTHGMKSLQRILNVGSGEGTQIEGTANHAI